MFGDLELLGQDQVRISGDLELLIEQEQFQMSGEDIGKLCQTPRVKLHMLFRAVH